MHQFLFPSCVHEVLLFSLLLSFVFTLKAAICSCFVIFAKCFVHTSHAVSLNIHGHISESILFKLLRNILTDILFQKLWKFFARYGIYTAIGVAAYFLTDLVLLKPETVTVSSVVINILICCAVPNVIFLLSFMFTPEFKYCAGFVFRKKNR